MSAPSRPATNANQLTLSLGTGGIAASPGTTNVFPVTLGQSLRNVREIVLTAVEGKDCSSSNLRIQLTNTGLHTVNCIGIAGQPTDGARILLGPPAMTTTVTSGATLPPATITVASTAGFPAAGSLRINADVVSYTGTTATTFTGCTGGTSVMTTNVTLVSQRLTNIVYFGTPVPLLDYSSRNTALDVHTFTVVVTDWAGNNVTFTSLFLMGTVTFADTTKQVGGNTALQRDVLDSYPRGPGWN